MNKRFIYLIGVLCMLYSNKSIAQLAPVGTTWYYWYYPESFYVPPSPEEKTVIIADTMIEGRVYSILNNGLWLSLDNGKLYRYYGDHYLLFDFNLSEGDSTLIDIETTGWEKRWLTIDSVYTDEDGLKNFMTTLSGRPHFMTMIFTEKVIRKSRHMSQRPDEMARINYSAITAVDGGYLLCTYIEPGGINLKGDCDTSLFTGIAQISGNSNKLSISPNPAQLQIRINFSKPVYNAFVEVITIDGKVFYRGFMNDQNFIIEGIDSWPAGFYFLSIKDNENIYRNKFIVSK